MWPPKRRKNLGVYGNEGCVGATGVYLFKDMAEKILRVESGFFLLARRGENNAGKIPSLHSSSKHEGMREKIITQRVKRLDIFA